VSCCCELCCCCCCCCCGACDWPWSCCCFSREVRTPGSPLLWLLLLLLAADPTKGFPWCICGRRTPGASDASRPLVLTSAAAAAEEEEEEEVLGPLRSMDTPSTSHLFSPPPAPAAAPFPAAGVCFRAVLQSWLHPPPLVLLRLRLTAPVGEPKPPELPSPQRTFLVGWRTTRLARRRPLPRRTPLFLRGLGAAGQGASVACSQWWILGCDNSCAGCTTTTRRTGECAYCKP
jgi:hypothetical protein